MSGVSMKRTASSTERWFGSFFSRRGVLTSFAGFDFDRALADEELEEGSQRGELARDRGLLLVLVVQLREPLADRDVVDLFHVRLAPLARQRVGGREVFEELREVDGVVPERVLAHVALVAEVFEKLRE